MSYEVVLVDDEDGSALSILRGGKRVLRRRDGGEPEDNYFTRDWNWVPDALEAAYRYGLEDGRAEKEDA